jgi:hypothetical protein
MEGLDVGEALARGSYGLTRRSCPAALQFVQYGSAKHPCSIRIIPPSLTFKKTRRSRATIRKAPKLIAVAAVRGTAELPRTMRHRSARRALFRC